MSIANYAELQTAIQDWLDDNSFTSNVPDLIVLGENRIYREVRCRELLMRSPLTVNARLIDLPTRFLEAKAFHLITNPVTPLRVMGPDELTRYRRAGTGRPQYFTVHDRIEFNVTPDTTYSAELLHYGAFQPLATQTTNALLDRAPDLYLYAALVAATPFIVHDERLPVWESLYQQAKSSLVETDMKARVTGPIYTRVQGATP